MTENITDSQAMNEVITDYLNSIDATKIEKMRLNFEKEILNERNQSISEILKGKLAGDKEAIKEINKVAKTKKKRGDTDAEHQERILNLLIELSRLFSNHEFIENVISTYDEKIRRLRSKNNHQIWIDWALANSYGVLPATHVAKLTHSSIEKASSFIDNSSIALGNIEGIKRKSSSTEYIAHSKINYLTTSSLSKVVLDGAYPGAASSPIVKFLLLEGGGEILSEKMLVENRKCLHQFSLDENQLSKWMRGFSKNLLDRKKKTHYLSKQLYYPISNESYQLIIPIKSSSLVQSIVKRLVDKKQEDAREKRKKRQCSEEKVTWYPNKAFVRTVASQPQNVSLLNSTKGRAGRIPLFSCTPPLWNTHTKPPLKLKNLFYGQLRFSARKDILVLQKFLLLLKKQELNSRDPKLHAYLLSLIDIIIERVFDYVTSMQNLGEQAGWTAQSKLKLSHQLWFDPFREEESFQQQRKQNDWQSDISSDFAAWLNKQLEHKKLILSVAQESFWKKIMQQRLRKFEAFREVKR